jgi:small multidrug resistance family-3 protein
MSLAKSILVFLLSGLCEIGGGYLVWLWLKEDKPIWYGVLGGLVLALYGVVATLQTMPFARAYATYGGIFIVLSFLWACKFDNFRPDRFDLIGAAVALLGVFIICYAPRN